MRITRPSAIGFCLALGLATIGGTALEILPASASSTTPPVTVTTPPSTNTSTGTAAKCPFAQLRVNAIAAEESAATARLTLLNAMLAQATSKNNTNRIQAIDARISTVNDNQAKRAARIAAIEQRCSVTPA